MVRTTMHLNLSSAVIAMVLQVLLSKSFKIVIFGDSIDRYTVIDWCKYQRHLQRGDVHENNWGGPNIRYASARESN